MCQSTVSGTRRPIVELNPILYWKVILSLHSKGSHVCAKAEGHGNSWAFDMEVNISLEVKAQGGSNMQHVLLGWSQQGLLGFRKCWVLFYLYICYFSSVGKLTATKKVSKMHLSQPSIVWGFINVAVLRDSSSFKHLEWEYVKAWKLLKVSLIGCSLSSFSMTVRQ